MIYRTPDYYSKFRCIADKCRDSCCIGWEIDIDADTADYYNSIGGAFGKRLKENISDQSFILSADDRCPFLNNRNLCDIYTELGEEHLCQICSDHPRYYEWFGSVKEGGIGLSCEEAARIILSSDFTLTETEIQEDEDELCDTELYDLLLNVRDKIFSDIKNLSLSDAMCSMLDIAAEMQSRSDNGEFSVPEHFEKTPAESPDKTAILHFYGELEPIDENWMPYLADCEKYLGQTVGSPQKYEEYLKRIGLYFIYRYFMKGVFDGEILSRVKLAAVSVWMIGHLWQCEEIKTGCCDMEKCAWIAKNYSKEVEYCEENIEAILDASYELECFSVQRVKGLFEEYYSKIKYL